MSLDPNLHRRDFLSSSRECWKLYDTLVVLNLIDIDK